MLLILMNVYKIDESEKTNNSNPDVVFADVGNKALIQMSPYVKFMKVKNFKNYSLRLTCN